jgi:hypothetical protein
VADLVWITGGFLALLAAFPVTVAAPLSPSSLMSQACGMRHPPTHGVIRTVRRNDLGARPLPPLVVCGRVEVLVVDGECYAQGMQWQWPRASPRVEGGCNRASVVLTGDKRSISPPCYCCRLLPWQPEGETHSTGIHLPSPSPPPLAEIPPELVTPAYLNAPPAVIPIDVGHQLFMNDFLIAATTLRRSFHAAQYYPSNPVHRPDRPWEKEGGAPTAMVFSDGVWYDPRDRQFKMWYTGGAGRSVCYATSSDGIHRGEPAFDRVLAATARPTSRWPPHGHRFRARARGTLPAESTA